MAVELEDAVGAVSDDCMAAVSEWTMVWSWVYWTEWSLDKPMGSKKDKMREVRLNSGAQKVFDIEF